jgi:hypothetical protein
MISRGRYRRRRKSLRRVRARGLQVFVGRVPSPGITSVVMYSSGTEECSRSDFGTDGEGLWCAWLKRPHAPGETPPGGFQPLPFFKARPSLPIEKTHSDSWRPRKH